VEDSIHPVLYPGNITLSYRILLSQEPARQHIYPHHANMQHLVHRLPVSYDESVGAGADPLLEPVYSVDSSSDKKELCEDQTYFILY
jgi:hypothetical protein